MTLFRYCSIYRRFVGLNRSDSSHRLNVSRILHSFLGDLSDAVGDFHGYCRVETLKYALNRRKSLKPAVSAAQHPLP